MQHVVPLVAEVQEPLGCVPCFRRIVRHQLVRDHLVHREVQPGLHRLAVRADQVMPRLERFPQLGVFGANEERAIVLLLSVKEGQILPTVDRRIDRGDREVAAAIALGLRFREVGVPQSG